MFIIRVPYRKNGNDVANKLILIFALCFQILMTTLITAFCFYPEVTLSKI